MPLLVVASRVDFMFPTRFAILISALVTILVTGCQTPEHRAARLHTGMSRDEVISLLGPPISTAHNGSLEVMNFDLTQPDIGGQRGVGHRYYVIFGRDRRVESFGPN